MQVSQLGIEPISFEKTKLEPEPVEDDLQPMDQEKIAELIDFDGDS